MCRITALLGALLAFLTLSVPSYAGTSYVYLQGGSAEAPSTTPCNNASVIGGNGMPYTVADCTLTTNMVTHFHFVVPNDFNDAVSANATVIVNAMPETDATGGHNVCWSAAISVFPQGVGGVSYNGTALATPVQNTTGISSQGQFIPIAQSIASVPFFSLAAGGAACSGGSCKNQQADLMLTRIPCSGGTPISGAAGIVDVYLTYST